MQNRLFRLLAACVLLSLLSGGVLAQDETAAPPVLRRVEPNTGSVSGGTRVTLIGSDFDTSGSVPVVVLVGGQPCPAVTVHSSTRITVVTPASLQAGAADVEVRNPGDDAAARLDAAFCYDDGSSWLARWYRIRARVVGTWMLLEQGGMTMILLGGLSLFGVAWAVHCSLVLRPSQIIPQHFLDKLGGHMSRSEVQEAVDCCQRQGGVFGRVALATLRRSGDPPHKVREVAQAAGSREASHLFQKISYLADIGVISPMLGLLGTVLGMIQAFKTIGMGEIGGKHILLAGAIYKAMVTTAAGLVIGIPAMALFYYFRGKLLRIVTDMEQVAEDVAEAAAATGEE